MLRIFKDVKLIVNLFECFKALRPLPINTEIRSKLKLFTQIVVCSMRHVKARGSFLVNPERLSKEADRHFKTTVMSILKCVKI